MKERRNTMMCAKNLKDARIVAPKSHHHIPDGAPLNTLAGVPATIVNGGTSYPSSLASYSMRVGRFTRYIS